MSVGSSSANLFLTISPPSHVIQLQKQERQSANPSHPLLMSSSNSKARKAVSSKETASIERTRMVCKEVKHNLSQQLELQYQQPEQQQQHQQSTAVVAKQQQQLAV